MQMRACLRRNILLALRLFVVGATNRRGLFSQHPPAAWSTMEVCQGSFLSLYTRNMNATGTHLLRIYHIKELMIRRELEKD